MILDSIKQQHARNAMSAINYCSLERTLEILKKEDCDFLHMQTPFGTWLHVAASSGALEIAKKLVELGLDINKKGGTFKGGALNEAASCGYIEIVQYFLACGAELDISESERNPLFSAIYGGHKEIVEFLIAQGIDFRKKYTGHNMKNMDALAFAKERGQIEIAKILSNLSE